MDWANERYVRIYTRDTLTWKRMRFEGQTVFMHVARKLDRSGSMSLDDMEPAEAIFVVTGVPQDFVEAGLPKLLDLDVFRIEDGRLYAPNWLPAQETKASAAERQRRYRDRKREGLTADGTDGDVYFVRAIETGLVKIGVSADVEARVAGFQTSIPGGVELIHSEAGGPVRERELHTVFQDDRANGEWFVMSDAIREYVTQHASRVTSRDQLRRNGGNGVASQTPIDDGGVTSRVTPSRAVPSLAVPTLADPPQPPGGRDGSASAPRSGPTDDDLVPFAVAYREETGRTDVNPIPLSWSEHRRYPERAHHACGGSVDEFRRQLRVLKVGNGKWLATQPFAAWVKRLGVPADAPEADSRRGAAAAPEGYDYGAPGAGGTL